MQVTLTLIESMVSDNRTVGYAGGIDNSGVLILDSSTINGNTVDRSIPLADGGFGDGIHNGNAGSLTIAILFDL